MAIVMHPRHGITARSTFLPTNADIQALLREAEQKCTQFQSRTTYPRFDSVCTPKDTAPDNKPFRPYPKLWELFKEEPWLMKGHTFEVLTEASKSLAMFGKDAARDVLAGRVA